MNKLKTIETHLVSNVTDPTSTRDSYNHYKNMSNLDSKFIRKLIYNAFDTDKLEKFEETFRNRQIFTPRTQIEDTRQ